MHGLKVHLKLLRDLSDILPHQGKETATKEAFSSLSSVFPTGSNSRLQIKFYVTVNSETFLCAHLNKKRRK